jgi:hypothetical protein
MAAGGALAAAVHGPENTGGEEERACRPLVLFHPRSSQALQFLVRSACRPNGSTTMSSFSNAAFAALQVSHAGTSGPLGDNGNVRTPSLCCGYIRGIGGNHPLSSLWRAFYRRTAVSLWSRTSIPSTGICRRSRVMTQTLKLADHSVLRTRYTTDSCASMISHNLDATAKHRLRTTAVSSENRE